MLGNRVTTVYDSKGRVEATIDIYGQRTTTVYDAFGRVEATIDVLNNRTTSVYDSQGRVEAVVNTLGRTTTVYDNKGRVEATVDALANRATTVYDATYGRVSATIDARNNRTTFLYDSRGRQEAMQECPSGRQRTHAAVGHRYVHGVVAGGGEAGVAAALRVGLDLEAGPRAFAADRERVGERVLLRFQVVVGEERNPAIGVEVRVQLAGRGPFVCP